MPFIISENSLEYLNFFLLQGLAGKHFLSSFNIEYHSAPSPQLCEVENKIVVQHYVYFSSNVGLRSSHFPRLTIHSLPTQIHHCSRHADKIICRDVLSAASGNRTRFAKERAVLKQRDTVMRIGVREARTGQGPSAQGAGVCHWITDLVLLRGRNFAFFVLCKLFKHSFKMVQMYPSILHICKHVIPEF